MKKLLAGALATLTLVSGAMAASAADARDYRHYRHDDDHDDAVVAGIAGLALGAALGYGSRSYGYSNPGYYNGYYGNGYYGNGYYGRAYAPPPPRYAYGPNHGYYPRYRQSCRTVSYWDPYYGGYVRQRQCW
jgi:hypothetical protein